AMWGRILRSRRGRRYCRILVAAAGPETASATAGRCRRGIFRFRPRIAMNLESTDEQRILRDSVERFVAQAYGFAERRAIAESPTRTSQAAWRAIADLGWLALPLPEADGGLGGGAVDTGILLQGLGRGLVLEPVLT